MINEIYIDIFIIKVMSITLIKKGISTNYRRNTKTNQEVRIDKYN